MAEICLENTVYHDVGEMVQVCAVIRSPEVTCPIQFAFNIILSTGGGMSLAASNLKSHYVKFPFSTGTLSQIHIQPCISLSVK